MRHTIPIRRSLQPICALALLWALVVRVTGGVIVSLDLLRVSSRNPRNPLVIGLVAGVLALVLSRPDVRRTLSGDAAWWRGQAAAALRAWRAHWAQLTAALVALGAALLQVHQWSGARPLWLDEQMVALNLRERALMELAGPLWLGQSAPFGWLALQRVTLVTLGESEAALRFVPLCFGLATLAVAFWIGRRWMASAGAPLLVLLCATGQWMAYYVFELKHYSADVFWAFWLPALTAWAMEPVGRHPERQRAAIWWAVAAVGHWTANGALLVTPGCAAVLLAGAWRRHGWREVVSQASVAAVWLASFGLHYLVAIRHTIGSPYLGEYWAFAFAPESAGAWGAVAWLAAQLEPIALKPGGSAWGVAFWVVAAAGLAVTHRRALGLAMASVPASALALAAFRLVPFFERLTLWAMPALYVGLALLVDHAALAGRAPGERRTRGGRGRALGLSMALGLAGTLLAGDIVWRGRGELTRATGTNHRLDDRRGVEWLMRNHQPGDVVITTHLALPALWWYGRVPIADPSRGGRLADGSPVLEVGHLPAGPRCRGNELGVALEGRRRALVYLGFRFDDVPAGFDQLLMDELTEAGAIRVFEEFTDVGRAAVVELGVPRTGVRIPPPAFADEPATLDGCVGVQVAERW